MQENTDSSADSENQELGARLKLMTLMYEEEKRKLEEMTMRYCDLKRSKSHEINRAHEKSKSSCGSAETIERLRGEVTAFKELSEHLFRFTETQKCVQCNKSCVVRAVGDDKSTQTDLGRNNLRNSSLVFRSCKTIIESVCGSDEYVEGTNMFCETLMTRIDEFQKCMSLDDIADVIINMDDLSFDELYEARTAKSAFLRETLQAMNSCEFANKSDREDVKKKLVVFLGQMLGILEGSKSVLLEEDDSLEYAVETLTLSIRNQLGTKTPLDDNCESLYRVAIECSARMMEYRLRTMNYAKIIKEKELHISDLNKKVSDHVCDIKELLIQLEDCKRNYENQIIVLSEHIADLAQRLSDKNA